MNKQGQTLILFVILLPILLLLFAVVVDTGIVIKEQTKLKSTLRTILKTTYQKKEEENYEAIVKELCSKNNIPTDNLQIEVIDTNIIVSNTYEKESIFGKIVGINSYKIKSSLKGIETNEGLKIEKE